MLDMILLGYLADGPRSGYDLKLLLETDGAHFWHAHHSQIYTTLRRLERRGLVRARAQTGRGLQERRVYRILAAGRDGLDPRAVGPRPPLLVEPVAQLVYRGSSTTMTSTASSPASDWIAARASRHERTVLPMAASSLKAGMTMERRTRGILRRPGGDNQGAAPIVSVGANVSRVDRAGRRRSRCRESTARPGRRPTARVPARTPPRRESRGAQPLSLIHI